MPRRCVRCARETNGRVITVEDHYAGGGIGDAVASAVAPDGFTVQRLAVREIPRSGTPEELLDRYGISARHIVAAVTSWSYGTVGNPDCDRTRRACRRCRRSCATIIAKPEPERHPDPARDGRGDARAREVETVGLPQAIDELHLVGAEAPP